MKTLLKRRMPLVSAVYLSFLIFTSAAFAQDLDDVTISGKVVDANNQPIVGATVTATLIETNVERTVVTDQDGRYRFPELQPGTYAVKVASPGFGIREKTNLITVAGQNVQLDFSLSPAGVRAEQTVTIEDDSSPVDTTRTVVGGTVTERELEELPNNTRSPLDFVFTLGGVAEEPLSVRNAAEDRARSGGDATNDPRPSPQEAGIFSLSGGAAYSNNITIDGLDNPYTLQIFVFRTPDIHISREFLI